MIPWIPTIAEIHASTEVLSLPDSSATVVKVGETFAVKFGHTVSSEEAEALQFISSNIKVPVPKFYETLVEPETGINFIVMEYINAKSLADLWPTLGVPDQNPAKSGPFNTEEDLNEGILERLAEHEPQAHLTLLRTLMTATLRDHEVKFTHVDL
ncbi:kinase-like domain-containing protein [Fusarium napiforme]|uniref:Kinase-like domain-containing protein n=1 Tax=Fusarium napiforme TaxID=42672 RepID=A0A8H5JIB6_9HYPO|nr:kinase-like domain-containing protein [Fusarium napiforme]